MPYQDLTFEILVWVLPLGWAGVLLFHWLRKREPPRRLTPPADVRAEFRRRSRVSTWYGLVQAAGLPLMALSLYLFKASLPGFLGSASLAIVVGVAGLLAFAAGHLLLHSEYRCPACGGAVTDGDGWLLNPSACPRCGAGLR